MDTITEVTSLNFIKYHPIYVGQVTHRLKGQFW